MCVRIIMLALLASMLLGFSVGSCQGEASDWGLIAVGDPILGNSWSQNFLIQWLPALPAFNHVEFRTIGSVVSFESPGLTNLTSPWVMGTDTPALLTADGPSRQTLNLTLKFSGTPPTQDFAFNWSLWNNGELKWTKDRLWRYDAAQCKWRFTESVDPTIPEPFSMVLGSLGLGLVAGIRRLRRS